MPTIDIESKRLDKQACLSMATYLAFDEVRYSHRPSDHLLSNSPARRTDPAAMRTEGVITEPVRLNGYYVFLDLILIARSLYYALLERSSINYREGR